MKMAAYNERSTDFEVNISSNALEQESRRYMAKQSYCDPCNRDGKQNKTTGFCVDCDEHLCTSCFNLHKKFKPLQHHILLDRLDMLKRKTSGKVKDICVDKCPSHTNKVIEYICQSCDILCCSVCIIHDHRKCQTVDFIPDIIEDIEKSSVYTDVNQAIKDQSDSVTIHMRNCGINDDINRKLRDSAKEDVRMKCQEIHTWLMEKEKEMMKRIEAKYNEEQQTINHVSDEVKTLKDDLEKVKSSLTTKKNSSQRCQFFVALQNAKLTTNEIHRRLQQLKSLKEVENYHFKESAYIRDIKSQREFGTIENSLSDTKTNIKFRYSIHTRQGFPGKMCKISEKMLLLKERYLTTLSLEFRRRESPDLSELPLKSTPADITKISETEVAVTFPEDGVINFYDVTTTGHVAKKKTIHVGKGCRGIQYFKNNFIVSYCHTHSGSVCIIDMDGRLKKEIVGSSKLVFQSPFSLALNPRNEILYVADGTGTITSLTLDGKVINKYENGMTCIYGINTDENGSVYVCFFCQGKMYQLSDKCSFVSNLIGERTTCLDVVFSEKNDFMYVSTLTPGEIIVYEII